ncbi:MAG: hypothetical protein K9H61_11520 [Bacteroidia bacterium]|nr:hypothetical protein [Bacteroidia bacterium]MCF8428412.1 hypothetical protein [Bacteroidia bacterium]MCF8447617.1 hypothetical protein [Bacteroidia bacterium]
MKHKNPFLFFVGLFFFLPNTTPIYGQTKVRFEPIPEKKIIPLFTADPRAHRLSFERNLDETSYGVSMGGIFPFLNYKKGEITVQTSISGSTYLTLARKKQAGSVNNIDFFGDFWLDISLPKNWALRFGTGHTSQHLSDDAIIAGNPFKNYARDYHQILVVHQLKSVRILSYGGVLYNYNFKTDKDISGKFQFQLGFEHSPIHLGKQQYFYYAGDIKWREELNFASTLNLQLGYKLVTNTARAFRFAINHTIGKDERGYYQPSNRNFTHLGIFFDF